MNLDQALGQCDMYVEGHAVSRRICREVSNLMLKYFGVLPTPGSIGQVRFPAPTNFLCFDVICSTKPSVTISLCGEPSDYAGINIDHLLVRARPGCVRIRTTTEFHRFAAMRAFFRAALIATGGTGSLKPGKVYAAKKRRKKPRSDLPTAPTGSKAAVGASLKADPAVPSQGTSSALGAEASPPPSQPEPTTTGTFKDSHVPEPPQPSATTKPPSRDPFLAPIDELELEHAADPDVFNPAPQYLHNAKAPPVSPPTAASRAMEPNEIRRELGRIAIRLTEKKAASLAEAAADIRRLRPHVAAHPDLVPSLLELVGLWRLARQVMERQSPCMEFGIPDYQATEILPPGVVIPSRPPQLGGRRDPLPPTDEVRGWLNRTLGTEDGVRQFCCFAYQENEPGAPPQPLIWFRRVPILGEKIAPLYRERRMERPWDHTRHPDLALLHDCILALTVVGQKGYWTAHVMRNRIPRLRPFLRATPDDALLPTTMSAVRYLEGLGLLYRAAAQTWRISPQGFRVFDRHIGPAWLEACAAG